MKRKFILLLLVISMQLSFAFSQNPLIKYLPDNASMVMNFNAAGLAGKIPGESFRQSFMYREIMKDPEMPFHSIFMNPEKSGIDFSAGIFLVITNESSDERPEPGVNIFIKLKDAALFTANMNELFKNRESAIQTYGTDRIMQTGKDMTAGWNNEVLIITSVTDQKIKEELKQLYSDSTAQNNYEKLSGEITDRLKRAQRNRCFELLTLKPQNSLSTNSRFLSLMNTVADIKTWNNGMANPFLGNKLMGLTSSAFSKLLAFTGKNKTSIVNFENGKIVMQSNSYPGDEVAAIYKKYPATQLNTDLTRRLPKGDILALMNTTYNPQMGIELMQKTGLKEMMEDFKNPVPFDFNLIPQAFGNNMLLAVIKADEATAVDSFTRKMDGIKLILTMPIASKAKFDELRATVKQLVDSMQQKEGGSKMLKEMKPVIKYTDSLFVLSLSPDVAADFINNKETEPALEWLQTKKQYPMVMALNMKAILKMAMGKSKGGKEEQVLMDMFDEMIVYGGNYENESLHTTTEFQFTNKADNALKQLFDMISLVADKNKQIVNEQNEDAKMDNIKIEKIEVVQDKNVPPPPKPPKKVVAKPKGKINR